MVTIKLENLIDFVADVFAHAESSPEEARRIATYLTTANLTGHDSHGVIRVPVYIRWKKMGAIVPDQTAEVVVDTPSLVVIDGRFGYGQTVTPQAVRIGIEKCKKAGLAALALRNSGHLGRVGDWAEMAAAEGLVSVHFVNAAGSLLVAPFGGVEKRLSTAPYCVGIPREGQDPIVLDFATSIVAEVSVRVPFQSFAYPNRTPLSASWRMPLTPSLERSAANACQRASDFGATDRRYSRAHDRANRVRVSKVFSGR